MGFMEWFVVISTLFLIGIGLWQVGIMKAQQPVEGKQTPQWYRKYWPMLAMALILLLNWIPLFIYHRNAYDGDDRHLELIQLKNFKDEEIVLDGKAFENCTFTNVTFVYRGRKTFVFANNKIFHTGIVIVKITEGPQNASGELVSGLIHFICQQNMPGCADVVHVVKEN